MPVGVQGVRASARSLTAAEASVRSGAALVAACVSNHLLPAVRTRVPAARGVILVLPSSSYLRKLMRLDDQFARPQAWLYMPVQQHTS